MALQGLTTEPAMQNDATGSILVTSTYPSQYSTCISLLSHVLSVLLLLSKKKTGRKEL